MLSHPRKGMCYVLLFLSPFQYGYTLRRFCIIPFIRYSNMRTPLSSTWLQIHYFTASVQSQLRLGWTDLTFPCAAGLGLVAKWHVALLHFSMSSGISGLVFPPNLTASLFQRTFSCFALSSSEQAHRFRSYYSEWIMHNIVYKYNPFWTHGA